MIKKQVAVVLDVLGVGGAEKALIEMLNAFDYERYDVTLWLRNRSGEWTSLVDKNVTIECWGIENSREVLHRQIGDKQYLTAAKSLYYKMKCRYWKKQWDMNEYYATMSLPSLSKRYDCVIAYQVMSTAVVATALYRLEAPKKVLWVHGRNMRLHKLNHFWDSIYKQFELVFCVSEKCRKDFARDFPKAGKNTKVFYNLLDRYSIEEQAKLPAEEIERALNNETILVTVGRLEPIKGQMIIPEVAQKLLEDGYHIKWYLIGEGRQQEELKMKIEACGVEDTVIMLGMKENPYPYINRCDIYVQTSIDEGFGLTVAEAKILNKPIVTTEAGVMSEQIINGKNGIIVPETDVQNVHCGIKMLLDKPDLRTIFSNNLQKEEYDNFKELKKLYDFVE